MHLSSLSAVQCVLLIISPAGTTMGGGRGAMTWGAVGGIGTTLMREAGTIGGIGVSTWPGVNRTTGAMGGLGITGTAESRVVRTEGGTCNKIIIELKINVIYEAYFKKKSWSYV